MMTPQEVANHSFSRAAFGGYNLAMVDDFLDNLTEDYTSLYNDNVILKNKLKVLSDTVEEYRATDNAMRKALLAAQQMAESMVAEAEQKKSQLVDEAEKNAATRKQQLMEEIAAEEYRLKQAQEATAAYVKQLMEAHAAQIDYLNNLKDLLPPDAPAPQDDPAAEIQANVSARIAEEDAAVGDDDTKVAPDPENSETPNTEELNPEVTRRFEDLKFGSGYRIS